MSKSEGKLVSDSSLRTGEKIANRALKSNEAIEMAADTVMRLRSEKLQKFWDGLSEETQRAYMRAEDRSEAGKFIEKWMPGLDVVLQGVQMKPTPIIALTAIMGQLGVITVKPSILKDSREHPLNLADIPDWAITAFCSYFGLKSSVPVIMTLKRIMENNENLGDKVRKRVREMEAADRRSKLVLHKRKQTKDNVRRAIGTDIDLDEAA